MDSDNEQKNHIAVKETVGFVDDLKYSINKKLRISADFDKICICGMGGSAIGGDILIDFLTQVSKVPITVIRFIDVPHWVNDKTLVIACSYSGNTHETVSMYEEAVKKGCTVIAITSGGRLMELCKKDGNLLIPLKTGVQPRNSAGLVIGYLVNVIETVGGAKCKKEVKNIIPALYRLRNKIGFKNPDSYAKKIAESIHGSVPVIYSTAGISASASRWKAQINENSKMMAFNGSIPEFNHNEIVGWSEATVRYNCLPVFLYEDDAPDVMKNMANASIETLKSYGVEPVVVHIRGKTVIERTLRAVMFGDYISLYLAFMNGVDPIDVKSITTFKERIAMILTGRKKPRAATIEKS